MQNVWDIDGEVRTQKTFSLSLEDFFQESKFSENWHNLGPIPAVIAD